MLLLDDEINHDGDGLYCSNYLHRVGDIQIGVVCKCCRVILCVAYALVVIWSRDGSRPCRLS